jgi:GDPmannose 4,6-dehydratase
MKKVAIVTGVTGQDGSYLAELLLSKGYKVYGMKRRNSSGELNCASHLEKDIEVVEGELDDLPSITKLCALAKANEFYNLAGQSHVGYSFKAPIYTAQVTGLGVLNCLEAIRESGLHTRFYQASTSELFGGGYGETLANEETPFHPRSPYGVAKQFGYSIVVNYREAYKMFACNGILFNHESPRRGINFVTRKVTDAVAKIKLGKQDKVYLGNLDSKRDWGHAKDYVYGMWLMLQQGEPEDFVLATGRTHSIRDLCKVAFEHAGLGDYQQYVEVDPRFYRPAEVDILVGDASKAKRLLGWTPETSFEDLVRDMVNHDLKLQSAKSMVE